MAETTIIIGLVQSLFGILIFISKKPKHISFNILTAWLAVIAIFLGALLLPFQVVDYFKPGIFPIIFLWGPLLYFYVSSLTIENFKFKKSSFLHILPVIIVGIHRSTINVISVTNTTVLANNPNYIYNKIYYSLLAISLVSYWVLSLNLILKHRKNIPFHFSNYTTRNSLTWLVFVMSLFLAFFLAEFFVPFFESIFNTKLIGVPTLSFNLTIFAFIIIFFGINQNVIYEADKEDFPEVEVDDFKNNSEGKYQRSALEKHQIETLLKSIHKYLENRKPYLNPDFSLQMMSEDLNVSRQKLSQALNIGQLKNFYKVINEYRIEEVKRMLNNPEFNHLSVLGIAFECGFNSKTSFNRIFKEETGCTPLQFKKSL
jgi:AraC-like DNA-binding protein